jgi:NAD-dependent dihydropyrimidine dehydrogenase PreA subunit
LTTFGNFSKLNEIQHSGKRMAMFKVEVDPDKCVGDEECVEVCPVDVFELQNGKAVPVRAEECLGCESCIEVCEEEAITVTEI